MIEKFNKIKGYLVTGLCIVALAIILSFTYTKLAIKEADNTVYKSVLIENDPLYQIKAKDFQKIYYTTRDRLALFDHGVRFVDLETGGKVIIYGNIVAIEMRLKKEHPDLAIESYLHSPDKQEH